MHTTAHTQSSLGVDPDSLIHGLRIGALLLLFAIFWSVYLYFVFDSPGQHAPKSVLFLLMLFSATLIAPFLIDRTIDPFSPIIFQMLLKCFWIGRPLIQILQGGYKNSMMLHLSDEATYGFLQSALILMVIGHLGYLLGYYSRFYRMVPTPDIPVPRRISLWRTLLVILLLVALGFIAYALIIRGVGSWGTMWRNFGRRRHLYSGLRIELSVLDMVATPLLLLFGLLAVRKGRISKWLFVVIGVISVILAATGDRGRVLIPILSLCVFLHYAHRRFSLQKLALISFLMIATAIWIQDLRMQTYHSAKQGFTAVPGLRHLSPQVVEKFLIRKRTVDFIGVLTYLTPERLPYQYGRTYMNMAFIPVPRRIWAGKPIINESGIVGRAMMGKKRFYGLPVGSEGIFFMNFHLPGVFLGMLLFGVFHRKIYQIVLLHRGNPGIIAIYAVILLDIMYAGAFNIFRTFVKICMVYLIVLFIGRVHLGELAYNLLLGGSKRPARR
tara:strand:- start:341 stop:1831 length:1491 start_codon:yes stop_codon:yes gene_type:complete